MSINEELLRKIANSGKDSLTKIRPDWDEYFMILARIAATRSTCLSRPTGAVIVKDKQVLSTGYNGSMPGVTHCSDEGKCFRRRMGAADAGKYDNCRSIHSEANAIAQAAKRGVEIEGSSVYVTLYPCYVCTKLMASAGIKKIYYEYEYKTSIKGYAERDRLWHEATKKAGIEIQKVDISEPALAKTLTYLLMGTSWRRELSEDGKPSGKIDHLDVIIK